MNKNFYLDPNLVSYTSFMDHDWATRINSQTGNTPLGEIFFDLQWAWKGAANTFYMPWLTISTMVATGLGAAKDHAFPARYIAALKDHLVQQMGLRNMANQKLRDELQAISERVRAEDERPPTVETEFVWQNMLQESEFRLSIWGSQRLAYGAVYYAYEDFVARCYRLTAGESEDFEVGRDFSQQFRDQYSAALRDYCWSDPDVHLARLTRHALVHNGGRLTRKLRQINHGHRMSGDDIQIYPALTKALYEHLKARVTRLLGDPDGPLAKSGAAFDAAAFV